MIIKQFNLTYFLVLLIIVIYIALVSFLFKKRSQRQKDLFMVSLGMFNILFFLVYKICLSQDDYEFIIWKELPLQLCNINMFIIPLAVIFKNKYLLSFGFYVAPLAAIMAITFPELAFTNNSIFLMRNIGFYGTHSVIAIMGILLFSLGYIKPNVKDFIPLTLAATVLSLFAFLINLLLFSITNVETNYFFTMHTSDISLLNLFYNLIPVKYIYLLPALGILIAYVLIFNSALLIVKIIKLKNN